MSDFTRLGKEVYQLAKQYGSAGVLCEQFIPIHLEDTDLELRYSTDRGQGDDVEFLFHLPNTKYARLGFIVYGRGAIEAVSGHIPQFDREDHEPTPPDVNTALVAVYEKLTALNS